MREKDESALGRGNPRGLIFVVNLVVFMNGFLFSHPVLCWPKGVVNHETDTFMDQQGERQRETNDRTDPDGIRDVTELLPKAVNLYL